MLKKKVIIYLLGTIGDSVVSIPSLRALRRYFGKYVELVLLHEKHPQFDFTPQDVLEALKIVDQFISYPFKSGILGKIQTILPLFFRIRKEKFDSAVYLLGSASRNKFRVKRDLMFFKLCGVKKCFCFNYFNESILYPRDNNGNLLKTCHESEFLLNDISTAGIEVKLEEDLSFPILVIPKNVSDHVDEWLIRNRERPDWPLVAICPGAKKEVCKWPIHRFEEIGKRIINNYEVEVILIGGHQEKNICNDLINEWKSGLNTCGKFSIMESAALLSRCSFMLGLDTGTTHLSAAAKTSCIVISSSHNVPGRWEPMGEGHIVLRYKVPCSGCLLKKCNFPDHPCMTSISVDDVWEAVTRKCIELGIRKISNI
jgi:ADP-heptose:LPS heptosyltransferase